jgi:methylmalonyl-CoA mutase cobalamin-binding subunit
LQKIPVVVGGIVSERDEKLIRQMGVKEVFRPFDSFVKIQERVKALVRRTGENKKP